MSNVNVKRVVENIRANTTVYTPIVEAVVNAIQAIDAAQRKHGEIFIRIQRAGQSEIDGNLPDVCGIEVADNGIGFTDENRESFDTLYSEHKSIEGGKGFGRFTRLKYFENVRVVSVYETGGGLKQRVFSMGKNRDIIINEKISATVETESRTSIFLDEIKNAKQIDKKLSTIAKHLVEKLLPYFIIEGYVCPRIVLSEQDGTDPIHLDAVVTRCSPKAKRIEFARWRGMKRLSWRSV